MVFLSLFVLKAKPSMLNKNTTQNLEKNKEKKKGLKEKQDRKQQKEKGLLKTSFVI